jgi:sodium/proline symporter
VVAYTMIGGFITVVATDVFQAILMIFTLIALPLILFVIAASNNIEIQESIRQAGPALSSLTLGKSGTTATLFILNGLSWALGYSGQPQLLCRMIALKNKKDVKTATWVAIVWTLIAYTGAIMIGIAGFAFVKSGYLGESATAALHTSEDILPVLAVTLVNSVLAGILLSGVISAMMSTASSELIVCSSAMSEDIYGNLSKKKMSENKQLWLNKILTLTVGLVAFGLVLAFPDTVYALVSYAWAGIGSSFGPALLLLLFWKKFSRAGVFASLLGGTVSAILWKYWLMGITGISERLASFVIAFVLAVLFSYLFPEKKNKNCNS